MNQQEANQKILELMNKEQYLSQEEIHLYKELILQCNLKIKNKYGMTTLIYALMYNKTQYINLNEEHWNYLIKNSDLTQQNNYGWTPLMHAFINNKKQDLNLSEKHWDYLFKNSHLRQKDFYGDTHLMYAFRNNKRQNLNLSEEQWDYLIQNSDLTQQNNYGWTPLFYALTNNKAQNLQLSSKQFITMYEILDNKTKQKTFQKLIQEHVESAHQYQEEINLLLYDYKLKPHEKTMNWLKEKQYKDIVKMIEKRDLFFKLNKKVNLQNKKEKIATIKL